MTEVRPAAPFSAWERTLAFRYLRTKRKNGGVALISIISFVAITLAVAVLIIVMSVMNGFREQLLTRTLGFNGHAYSLGAPLYDAQGRDATLDRIRHVPGVIQVFPMVETQTLIQASGPPTGAIVRGVTGADLRATPIIAKNIKEGSLKDFGEGEDGGQLVIVGDRLAAQQGLRLGDPLTIASISAGSTPFGTAMVRKTYTVGGIFAVGMAQYDQSFVYMPLTQAQLLFGKGTDVDAVVIMVKDPVRLDDVLPKIHAAAGKGAIIQDWRDRDTSFWGAIQVERNVMRLILMLIIAIAALNIISGLVMLVKNKGRDIAILRTMGASQGSIMRIFFMSGAAVGVIATPAGLLLGLLFCTYIDQIQGFVDWLFGTKVFNADVYFLTSLPAKIDWSEVLVVTGWTLFMSCITTIWPAWRGSKIDPVEALRYE